MSDNNDFGNFFAGFIMGGLVGAAVALLMAPHSGEETRAIIKDRSIELKDKAVVYGQDAKAKAEKAMLDARARVELAVEDLQKRADDYTQVSKGRATSDVILEEQKAMPAASAPPAAPTTTADAKSVAAKK